MAVACTNILQTGSAVDGTSYSTASISPVANRLYILLVKSRTYISTDPNVPSVSGCGITWNTISSIAMDNAGTSRQKGTLYWGLNASPSSGALTFDLSGQTQQACSWVLDELTGINTTSPIVQSKTAVVASGATAQSTITATLDSAFSSVNNATYGAIAKGSTANVAHAGSGFTQIGYFAETTENSMVVASEFRNDNDTSIDWTLDTADAEIGVWGVEIAAAVTTAVKDIIGGVIPFAR